MHPARAVGRNEIPFGRDTRVVPSNTVLDRCPDPPREGEILGSEVVNPWNVDVVQGFCHLDVTVRFHLSAHDFQLVVIHLTNLAHCLRQLLLPEVPRFRLRVAIRQHRHLFHLLQAQEDTTFCCPLHATLKCRLGLVNKLRNNCFMVVSYFTFPFRTTFYYHISKKHIRLSIIKPF